MEEYTDYNFVDMLFHHRTLMWWLLIGGLLLVGFSQELGILFTENCTAPGACIWDTTNVSGLADLFRSLGFMLFAAGLVERVLLVVQRFQIKITETGDSNS